MNNGPDESEQEDSAIASPPHLTPDNLEPVPDEPNNLVQLASEKRNAFLRELQVGLDMLVYIELSCIYYTDCASLRLLLRAAVQFAYLTPKPAHIPVPRARPYVGAILGSNIVCFLLHLFYAIPAGGEATRGYRHGSVLIDFVGQKVTGAKSERARLLLLDVLVCVLQLVGLAVLLVLRDGNTVGGDGLGRGDGIRNAEAPAQDLDSEERGILQSDSGYITDQDIEMQPLASASASTHEHASRAFEGDALLSSTDTDYDGQVAPSPPAHPLDPHYSGRLTVATLYVADTVRTQFQEYRDAVRRRRVVPETPG